MNRKIKFKPILMTATDGKNYVIDDFVDDLKLLQRIVQMPKQKPISFANGYRLWSEHLHYLFEQEDGGSKVAQWGNKVGDFPLPLIEMGYHIELTPADFELIA